MSGLLAGKRVLVTGGTTGLGAAMVRRFAAEGALGVCLDIAQAEAPAGWPVMRADVRDEDELAAAIAKAADQLGGFDILLPNAGIVPPWAGIAETSVETWDQVIAINVRGVFLTLRAASPHLADESSIVVTASLNSWKGDPNIVPYVASKHAVLGIVRSAAIELGRRGIRVNAVGPGPIATEALVARVARRNPGADPADVLAQMGAQTFLGRIATEDDVANAVLFLASPLANGITGQLLHVDGGVD